MELNMKFAIAAVTVAMSFSSLAQAKSAANCAFGQSSADLQDRLDETGKGKALYQIEHISLHRPERINGLSAFEKQMIMEAVTTAEGKKQSQAELLNDFSSADGYITYFQHNSNGREFAAVASFPGDNEFGLIFEIKQLKRGAYQIVQVAAVISDGDLEDCVVEYEKP
jgi:hypothetical protein